MRDSLNERLAAVVRSLLERAGDSGEVPAFALEASRSPEHGDFACNAALLLAKRLRKPPRAIAEEIAAELGDVDGLVERVEVAGPGFVNVRLSGTRGQQMLRRVLEQGARYGRSELGKGQRVLSDDPALTSARLGLAQGIRIVLANALSVVGISVPERM